MQQHIHTIVKHFFQKDSLQEVSETVLQEFTEQHPYSSVGHWLLARKIHDAAEERFPAASARAVTWFNNPLWLDWTLGDHEKAARALVVTPATVKETPVTAVKEASAEVLPIPVESVVVMAPEPVAETPVPAEEPAVAEPVVTEPELVAETPAPVVATVAETIVIEEEEEVDEDEEILIPGVSEPVKLKDIEALLAEPAVAREEVAEPVIEEPPIVEIPAPAAVEIPSEPAASEADTIEAANAAMETADAIEEMAEEMPEAIVAAEEVAIAAETAPAEAPAPTQTTDKEAAVTGKGSFFSPSVLAGTGSADTKSVSEIEEPVFEPYHTIDYFASLGIKLRQEDMRDKLGQQLKSFTEWLRSMKKIAPVVPDTSIISEETLQQNIQEIADHSVEGKEVITEAMADVWAKQGHHQKAIGIYEKLSLLNPTKSAYFAAKIDELKKA